MASRTMDLSVIVRVIDKLTGPVNAIQRRLSALGDLVKRIGGNFGDMAKRIGTVGAVVAGISFAAPIAGAATFDQALRDIVVTNGLFGAEAEAKIVQLRKRFNELAQATGIGQTGVAKAAGLLSTSGMEEAVSDKILEPILRVSKAASAMPEDVAKVAFALVDKLKVPVEEVELQLAKLVKAGKLGRFEFRDMARELPELATQLSGFGITGSRAVEQLGASLQVAMFGSDSTSTAANNFKNLLSKALSPETIKKFKDFGVDIGAVMKDAAFKQINPIEALIEKVSNLTGMSTKDMAAVFDRAKKSGMTDAQAIQQVKSQIEKIGGREKLAAVFGDMQVLDFMLPMLQNLDRYKEFLTQIKAAGLDEIANDFKTQWAGLQNQLDRFGISTFLLKDRIGLAFSRTLPFVNEKLEGMLRWVKGIDERFPGVIDDVLVIGGAFLLLLGAVGILTPVIVGIGTALGALGFLIGPIGVAILGFAGLAYLVYANWSTVGPMFARLWEGITQVFSGFLEWVAGIFTLDATRAADGVRAMFEGLGTIAGAVWDLAKVAWTGFGAWIDNWTSGTLTAAINGIKAAWQGFIDWFKSHVPSLPDIQLPDWAKRLYSGPTATLPAVDAPTTNPAGDATGWSAPGFAAPAAPATAKVGGEIVVRAEPGTEARVQSDNPSVPMVQDRGLVLGRP